MVFREISKKCLLCSSYECPPMMIRIIFRFRTKNRITCQGKNFRQNRVVRVGIGGKEISFGP